MSFQSSRDRSAVTLVRRQPGKRVSSAVLDESVRGLRDLAKSDGQGDHPPSRGSWGFVDRL
jgi:hypothetical protein